MNSKKAKKLITIIFNPNESSSKDGMKRYEGRWRIELLISHTK